MTTKVVEVINSIGKFIEKSQIERKDYFTSQAAFTRKRSLTLQILIVFLMQNSRRTLGVELQDFFDKIGLTKITKSALSQARYKVRIIFFSDLFIKSTQCILENMMMKKWKGFQLCAVDGSTMYLLDGKAILEEFGGQINQYGHNVMARIGFKYDVLNKICVGAIIQAYNIGEDEIAREFLKSATKNQLVIYDRLFPSYEVIVRHLALEVQFLMRCKISFNTHTVAFAASKKKDAIVEFTLTTVARKALLEAGIKAPLTVRVRLLRIDIGQAEPEILITSLLSTKKYPYSCFKALYNMRWGVETYIGILKNIFQLQVFSGYKPEAIYQDFFLSIIAFNIQSLLINECEKEVKEVSKTRKFDYAINRNVATGIYKQGMAHLFITKKTYTFVSEMKRSFLRNLEPIRPGRSFERTKKVKFASGRYFTDKTHKRAA